jgi:arginyl-tRNA synthetase
MEIENLLKNEIKEVIKSLFDLQLKTDEIKIEPPQDESFGDLSTNIALQIAKKLGKAPQEIAQEIAEKLQEEMPKSIEKIEIAGPGFINFKINNDKYFHSIQASSKHNTW